MFYDTKQTITNSREANNGTVVTEEKTIMIEISLAEYRDLLSDNIRFAQEIERLDREIECIRDKR